MQLVPANLEQASVHMEFVDVRRGFVTTTFSTNMNAVLFKSHVWCLYRVPLPFIIEAWHRSHNLRRVHWSSCCWLCIGNAINGVLRVNQTECPQS